MRLVSMCTMLRRGEIGPWESPFGATNRFSQPPNRVSDYPQDQGLHQQQQCTTSSSRVYLLPSLGVGILARLCAEQPLFHDSWHLLHQVFDFILFPLGLLCGCDDDPDMMRNQSTFPWTSTNKPRRSGIAPLVSSSPRISITTTEGCTLVIGWISGRQYGMAYAFKCLLLLRRPGSL